MTKNNPEITSKLVDTKPLYNLDIEKGLLGLLILYFESKYLDTLNEYITRESFYADAHKIIYGAINDLSASGSAIDLKILVGYLNSHNNFERVGGIYYLNHIVDNATTPSYLLDYTKHVLAFATRRDILKISDSITYEAKDLSNEVSSVIEMAEKRFFDLDQGRQVNDYITAQESVKIALTNIKKRREDALEYSGIPSGFTKLDELTSGFQDSELTIIGARPSIGKTAFALSIFHNVAIVKNMTAAFFSLEMPADMIMERLLASDSRLDGNLIRKSHNLKASEWGMLGDSVKRIVSKKFFIADTPNMSLANIRSQARRLKSREDIKIIFIDYIGLIRVDEKMDRHLQISLISKTLKALARELKIPVIVLAQVGRAAEKDEPSLANLAESGSLEQDADVVIFLHRSRELSEKDKEKTVPSIDTKLIVAKNRNGPIDNIDILFIPKYVRFDNSAY